MDDPSELDLTYESLIHDLNNVFETISDAAELLKGDRRWKSLADTLCRSITRGRRLLGAIPDSTPYLAAIIEDAIQSVTDYCIAARKPRMRFVRQLSSNTRLPGSAKDWERVFVNLFLNAAEVMHKPGRIDIATEEKDGQIIITISDNGPGIPEDLLPRLFRPHVSTKNGSNTRTGLGLHIVDSIAKKYSGRVAAANRERSSGAVFTIEMPMS